MDPAPEFINSEQLRDKRLAPLKFGRPGRQIINPAAEEKAPTPAQHSLHILCIDDDVKILGSLQDCLTHYGHRVRIASGGKAGIEQFAAAMAKREPFDVVITDLGMPDITGCQVALAIKAASPHTPVVMLTGEAGITTKGGIIVTAVDVVVGKPPLMKELNDLLLRVTASIKHRP